MEYLLSFIMSWLFIKLLGIPLLAFVVWANIFSKKEDGGPRGVIALIVSNSLVALWLAAIVIRGFFW